jgi:hypothetical protein
VILADGVRGASCTRSEQRGHGRCRDRRLGLRYEDVDLPTAVGGAYFLRVASTSGASATEYALSVRLRTKTVAALSARTVGGFVYGEWVNNGSSWVVVPFVNLAYFNSSGALLRRDQDVVVSEGMFYLPPHGRVPFGTFPATAGVPRGTARVVVTPQPVVVSGRSAVRLTASVTSVTFPAPSSGASLIDVRGTMTNHSSRTVRLPTAVLEVFTARGILAGTASDRRPSLAAGASTTFDTSFAFWSQLPSPRYCSVRVLDSPSSV